MNKNYKQNKWTVVLTWIRWQLWLVWSSLQASRDELTICAWCDWIGYDRDCDTIYDEGVWALCPQCGGSDVGNEF